MKLGSELLYYPLHSKPMPQAYLNYGRMVRRNLGWNSFHLTCDIYRTSVHSWTSQPKLPCNWAKWGLSSHNSYLYFRCPTWNNTNCFQNMLLSPHCLSRAKKVTGSVTCQCCQDLVRQVPSSSSSDRKSIVIPGELFQCLSIYFILKIFSWFRPWACIFFFCYPLSPH